ncbi:NAD-dependent epimerase/dehydratase family protein [Micromonospora sp. NPDC047548]|uniref:NAD-dependent epimerase/dehydratase family protein n=1 Tax=Micromonospora sp. NPDC047548 TaxID=3155624 RepID=UPI0033F62673
MGTSGNVGTALLRRLRPESGLELAGVARRLPGPDAGEPYDGVAWHSCDVGAPGADGKLAAIFAGADAVVHLAWQIQPSHDQRTLHRTNVGGSHAVIEAAVRAGVPALVYASSVGAYAPGPKDHPISERWPATGVPGSSYSRDKAEVESMIDRLESEHPSLRVVRLRPGLVFQRDAGTEITRYFLGPLAPVRLLRFGRIPVVPANRRPRMQAVHADAVPPTSPAAPPASSRPAPPAAATPTEQRRGQLRREEVIVGGRAPRGGGRAGGSVRRGRGRRRGGGC